MRKRLRRALTWLAAAALCLGVFAPMPAHAAAVYFTSVNDNLLPLSADTMPFWSGGALYVPYTIFDGRNTGVDLGVTCGLDRDRNTISIYNLRRFLTFDLATGAGWDDKTQTPVSWGAIVRNGRPYVPLGTVCGFFGLTYSYTSISYVSQGFLVRIKSSAAVLSDSAFLDAAWNSVQGRLREYDQGVSSAPPSTAQFPTVQEEPETGVSAYLAFRCESGEGVDGILDALGDAGAFALFLFTPEALERESALARRVLGSGHSVGILAQGEKLEQVREQLEKGARLAGGTACLRLTLADVPEQMRKTLQKEGWVCWRETLSLSPGPGVGTSAFASNVLRRLSDRTGSVYLTLEAGEDAARVLPALLRRMELENYAVAIPLETRI